MADYHEIVEQIRTALHAGTSPQNGRLAGLASAYADACADASHRLARCQRLLQQGLRSEAIQLAEAAPKLLDALAVLDFPERPEWDDLVQMHDLAPAPRIPLEPARLLNEAYAEEDPLQDLLRRHRRLALQRAPLRQRIAVLRQLAVQDPNNAIWTDDLRAFEQVRMLEIQDEASDALRLHDPERLGRLVAEVEQSGWGDQPSRPLVQSLRKVDAQMKAERARAELEDLAGRMEEAHNNRDSFRARQSRHEWTRLAAAVSLERDDPLAQRVRPVLDWLDDQDRIDRENREHQDALDQLVRALDYPGNFPPSQLERLAHAVGSHPDGLPDALRQRYITRLHDAERADTRRRRLIVAGSAAAVLLVASLVYMAVRAQARSSEAERVATRVGDHLELNELDQAVALLKKVETSDPVLLDYPALADVRARVEAEQQKETDRALKFDQAMRDAEAAPPSSSEPPALAEARKLARLDTEKSALDNLVRRRAAAIQAQQARRDKELIPRLDEIAASVDRAEARLTAPGARPEADREAITAIAEAERGLADIADDVAISGQAVQDRSKSLSDRLDAARALIDRRGLQTRLESAITSAVAYSPDGSFSPGALTLALQAYAKAFPDTPRSRAFATTVHDQPAWDAIGEWDRITAGWRGDREGDAATVPPQEASARASQCRQFMTQFPASPEFDRAAAYRQAMEAMSHRSAEAEGSLGKLRALMADLLVDNLWMVTLRPPASGGERHYYLTEQPARDARSVRYLAGFDGKERPLNIVPAWVVRTEVAPQTKLAARFKPLLQVSPEKIDWEPMILDMIDQVRTQPGLDPVLRVALLRNVLALGMEGSDPLQQALGGFRKLVDEADVDTNVPWMDPENREADQVRPKALALVRSLPDIAPARKHALARRDAIRRVLAERPRTVGWLAREGDAWQIRTGTTPAPDGAIQLVVPGDGGHSSWRKIGAVEKGKPRLAAPDDPALAEGRPVFLAPASPASATAKP
ncbi:MAG: hypothetical protein ACYC61_02120 [Isosphaeraceae bacterium]